MRFFIFDTERRSPLWKKVRNEHIAGFPFCAACGRTSGLEVHHVEPVHHNPARELDPTNLITLCDKYCHLAIGHLMNTQSWNTEVVNDSAVYLNKVKHRPYKVRISSYENPTLLSRIYAFLGKPFSRDD